MRRNRQRSRPVKKGTSKELPKDLSTIVEEVENAEHIEHIGTAEHIGNVKPLEISLPEPIKSSPVVTSTLDVTHSVVEPSQMKLKQEAFDACYKSLKPLFTGEETTTDQMIEMVKSAMQFVERYNLRSGADKKDIVLKLIRQIIFESDISQENKRILMFIPYGTIIDSLVDATRGGLQLNVEGCTGLKKCLPFLFK